MNYKIMYYKHLKTMKVIALKCLYKEDHGKLYICTPVRPVGFKMQDFALPSWLVVVRHPVN